MRLNMKRILIIFVILLLGISAHAADGDITAVRINASGWYAEVDIENLAVAGTYDFGLGTYNNPSTAKMVFTVTSAGYTDDGTATTIVRTVYGTNYKRKIYPNNASADESSAAGTLTVLVALSEWIYSSDTLTVSIASAFYTKVTATGIATNMAVTNNSAEAYPRVVANWAWPGESRIAGSSFTLRCVAYHRSAQQGKPVKVVKFTATDQHAHTVTAYVTAPTIDRGMADAIPVIEYVGTISTSTLTQGDTITCNFIAYPWYGDAGSLVDTSDAVNTMPTPLYAPQSYLLDKDNTYGVTVAVVDSVAGNDGTGAAVDYVAFNYLSPPNAYATIAAAASAIAAYNNTNHSRNNTAAGILYLKEGNHVFSGGTVSAGGQADGACWTTITKFPGTTRANVLIVSAATTKQVSEKLKLEDIKITNSTTVGFTGMNYLWLHNCDIFPTGAATFYVNTINYFTHNSLWSCAEYSVYSTVTASRALFRGNTSQETIAFGFMPYTFIGNNIAQSGGVTCIVSYAGQTVPTVTNAIYAHNFIRTITATDANISSWVTSTLAHGIAIIQNILERVSGTSAILKIGADSSTIASDGVNNVLIWYNTSIGQRWNLSYNDYILNDVGPAYRKHWSIKGNIIDDYNCVTDIDAHGGTPDNDRYGNHSVIHGVGFSGNIILNRVGTEEYENKFGGLLYKIGLPLDPVFINDESLATSGGGNGNYNLLINSPSLSMIPSSKALLPYDFVGHPRRNDGTGAIGAYEYRGKVGGIDSAYKVGGVAYPAKIGGVY